MCLWAGRILKHLHIAVEQPDNDGTRRPLLCHSRVQQDVQIDVPLPVAQFKRTKVAHSCGDQGWLADVRATDKLFGHWRFLAGLTAMQSPSLQPISFLQITWFPPSPDIEER